MGDPKKLSFVSPAESVGAARITGKGLIVPLGVFLLNKRVGMISRNASFLSPGLAFSWSDDGVSFVKDPKKVSLTTLEKKPEKLLHCHDFRIISTSQDYLLTYVRESIPAEIMHTKTKSGAVAKEILRAAGTRMFVTATSKDMYTWKVINEKKTKDSHIAFLSRERFTDVSSVLTPKYDHVLWSNGLFGHVVDTVDGKEWKNQKGVSLASRPHLFDSHPLALMGATQTSRGIILFYDSSFTTGSDFVMQIGGVMVSANDPTNIVWRSDEPLWRALSKAPVAPLFPLSAVAFNHKILLYWTTPKHELLIAEMTPPFNQFLEGSSSDSDIPFTARKIKVS